MSIPVNTKVRAVPNLLDCLRAARAVMVEQDTALAPARFQQLQSELVRARSQLSFSPTSGRPARFLDAKSGWGRFQALQAVELWRSLGMPELRKLVLARHVLLYAHSENHVLLLALRHERQSAYRLSA